jgi:hypothetical protein
MGIIMNCHACMHGLIHDGQLWACQSCLLRLMYVIRLLCAIRCLGFQLVGGCIKGQAFPFSCRFFKIILSGRVSSKVREFFHSHTGFLDAHNNYYMATIYIHYIFFLSLQFSYKKTFFGHLMLKVTISF